MLLLNHEEVNKYFGRIYMKNIFEVSEKELEVVAGGKFANGGEAALTGFVFGSVNGSLPVVGSVATVMTVAKEDDDDNCGLMVGGAVVGSAVSSLVPMGIGAGLLKFKQWLNARSKKAKAREIREIMDMARNLK